MFEENYNNLERNIISSSGKIRFSNKNSKLIPINTKSNEEVFKEGSFRIIGELSRILCKKQVLSDFNDLNLINDEIEVNEDSEDIYYLKKLFEDYLSKNSLHPKLLLQNPLSENDEMRRSEQNVAKFLYDVIFKDLDGVEDFFNDNIIFQSNFLISHIMDNLEETEYNAGVRDEFLCPYSMKNVVAVIKKDFQFAFEEQKFLLNNFEKMVSYYVFFYFSQFLLKTSTTECSQNIEETYYLLDWESASSGRDSLTKGYNRVQNYLDILKIKMDVIEHLNLLLGKKNMLVPEIREYCSKQMDIETRNEFKEYLSRWINKIRELEGLDNISLSSDINGLIKDLENSIKEAYEVNAKRRSGTVNRYRQVIKCLAETYFIKKRGPYGINFNIDLELLLLITRLCIGHDENISFNHLIEEYRNRGLFFDEDSKEMILSEFEKLNLIDKKSDSEEVQYVRLFL